MLYGVDVSAYQPENIIRIVRPQFAIIKVTQGVDYVSPVWEEQVNDCINLDVLFGLYHFADGGNVQAELEAFWKLVQPYYQRAWLGLDYEPPASNNGGSFAFSWLNGLRAIAPNNKPFLYGSESIVSGYRIPNVALYNANYDVPAHPGPIGAFTDAPLYQYTSSGHMERYAGDLDLDVFYGDANTWAQYVNNNNIPTESEITQMFRFSYKGWWGIAVPSNNPDKPLHAIVLGAQDTVTGFPTVNYTWANAYQMLYDALDNADMCPAP